MWSPYRKSAPADAYGIMREGARRIEKAYAQAAVAFLEEERRKASRRWVTLLPEDVLPGAFCKPGESYTLAKRLQHGLERFCFCSGQRVVRFMTHPADARAGWHFEPSFQLSVDALSTFDGEISFSAFHWALQHKVVGYFAETVFLEPVQFAPTVVLRATHPAPMVHGLWIEFEDWRCAPGPDWRHRELYELAGVRLGPTIWQR
jgi:hypothetical protein